MLGSIGELLRALVNGPDPSKIPAPQEVIPVMEAAPWEASFAWSAQKFLYTGYALESAGAARSQVALINPVGSGVVALVTEINVATEDAYAIVTTGTAAQFAGFDNDGAEGVRDSRLRVSTAVAKNPACRIISDDAALTGTTMTRLFPTALVNTIYRCQSRVPYVLFPNSVLNLCGSANAKYLNGAFDWMERRYEQAELRGTHHLVG